MIIFRAFDPRGADASALPLTGGVGTVSYKSHPQKIRSI